MMQKRLVQMLQILRQTLWTRRYDCTYCVIPVVTVDWFPKINTIVHSQVQKCDAEMSGTDVADCEANSVDQEV